MDRSQRFRMITEFMHAQRAPRYRIEQVLDAVYRSKIKSFADMHHVPKVLRHGLHEHFNESLLSLKPLVQSKADRACKVLFENKDGSRIESVLLHFPTYKSLCISSQVGCAHACSFCATGKIGLLRNLTVDEITDQILYFQQQGNKIDSISFMGMGEPLSNPNVFRALKVLSDPKYFGISPRRLNVSTVGILPGVKKLNSDHSNVNLAFSLHSPYTKQRNEMVPVNILYPFHEVFDLLDQRISNTGKRIWISYVLIKDLNDSRDHGNALASLIQERHEDVRYLYHVNLIPYNIVRVGDPGYEESKEDSCKIFEGILKRAGISCSYRNYFGRDIDAACGQLYADYTCKKPKRKV